MHIFHDWQPFGPVKEDVMEEKPHAILIAQYQVKKCVICGKEAEFWLAWGRNRAIWVFNKESKKESHDTPNDNPQS